MLPMEVTLAKAASNPMSKDEFTHYRKVSTALELYSSILDRCKDVIIKTFDVKSMFHDGEKRLVLDIARDIFKVTVDEATIQRIVDGLPAPNIETISVSRPPTPTYEPAPGGDGTTAGMKVAGF
mgnify:CR=1 FL=1